MQRLSLMAGKDFRDSIRDRQLYVVGVLFLLVGGLLGYMVGQSPTTEGWEVPRLGLMAMLFVGSLAMIVISYHGIVGKRDSGELRVLLSLPFSRTEVVFGTYLGRLSVVGSLAVGSLLLASLFAMALGSTVAFGLLGGALLVTVVILLVYASIGIGISAGSANSTRAAALAFGAFFTFTFRLWEAAPAIVRLALNGFGPLRGEPPTWALLWGQLSPLAGLHNAVGGFSDQLAQAFTGFAPGAPADAVYAEPWFGALVVLAWIVLPVALGYQRFTSADL